MHPLVRITWLVVGLTASVWLAGCAITDVAAVPGGAVRPLTTPTPAPVYLNECGLDLVSEPGTFTLTCADAGQTLQGLTWTDWGAPEATATGKEVINLCKPNCAAGRVASTLVTVRASRLTVGRSASAYTRLEVSATGRLLRGVEPRQVFTLHSPDVTHSRAKRR